MTSTQAPSGRVLVTGSAGHLGEALLRRWGSDALGLDRLPSAYTSVVAHLGDRDLVRAAMRDTTAVVHTATLHKPHVATHPMDAFVETNISGTLTLLEAARDAGTGTFVFISTTSAFGDALRPPAGEPTAWITEAVAPRPKNIYGATKTAAEDLCELFAKLHGLHCIVLRTSRFFPEDDDDAAVASAYDNANTKANEFLNRRVDIEDIATAIECALARAANIGFGRFIVSATTPFARDQLSELRADAPAVVRRCVPGYEAVYAERGWRMFPSLDRVYVNARARDVLGWTPRYDFARIVEQLAAGELPGSELARAVGSKGYHRAHAARGESTAARPG